MTKKPLAELFRAMYHGKYDYRDFIGEALSSRYKPLNVGGAQVSKERLVYAPDKTLKIYHSFLNLFLFEYLDVNEEVVFSYRKGVNVVGAVRKHAHNKHFFQADLQDFFLNINSTMVRAVIENVAARTPISDVLDHVDRIIELVTIDGTLPIGFPASPLISNAVLRSFDDRFEDYCALRGMVYTRYSDDLIVSSQNRDELTNLAAVIEEMLQSVGLAQFKLNPEKTKITSVGRKIKLLGLVILPNGVVSVDIKLKQQIETMLHFYITDNAKFRDFSEKDLTKATEQLSGYVNYVNTVDPAYLDKLRKKYGVTVIDTLMHQGSK
ncbi:reverse transcriptase domain-containing protein [Trinickia diaoshuihuensis]|uniref:reverse transcriptase domain-containing protein n=1 Tax=Trinickia diaoshuihuensis TaxID=2292265 RepID=UPI000E257926|nr:reverse transcriptase domain-containing protein [Trinickia diaoshuihuensis]